MGSISQTLRRTAIIPTVRAPWLRYGGLASLLAITALSSYNAVTTDRFAWDLSISRWVQQVTVGESLEEALFYMGVLGLGGVAMTLAFLWLWLKGHRVDGVLLLLALTPNGAVFFLRDLFDRPRPSLDLVNVIGGAQGASYPSGHGFMVVFLYGFLFYLLTKYTDSRRVLSIVLGLIVLYVPFAGLWLINHGRHWPSDVVGGYMYGGLALLLWVQLHRLARAWEARHPGFFTMRTIRRLAERIGLPRGA